VVSVLNKELKLSDLRQGDNLSSLVKHLTQQDINRYAEASGDFNPIHIDESFAAQTPLGGTIAHGMLILAYVSEMMTEAFGKSWLSGGKLSVRFKAPARPKDAIIITGKINSIEYEEGVSHINCDLESHNQKGEVIIVGKATVKLCA
jgi:3-hydroxybutyryl-CoA dehydratase